MPRNKMGGISKISLPLPFPSSNLTISILTILSLSLSRTWQTITDLRGTPIHPHRSHLHLYPSKRTREYCQVLLPLAGAPRKAPNSNVLEKALTEEWKLKKQAEMMDISAWNDSQLSVPWSKEGQLLTMSSPHHLLPCTGGGYTACPGRAFHMASLVLPLPPMVGNTVTQAIFQLTKGYVKCGMQRALS